MWYRWLVDSFKRKIQDEDGQSLVEYGLLLALIAVVCILIITTLGTQIRTVFTDISNKLPGI